MAAVLGVVGERLQDQDLDQGAGPPALLRGDSEPLEQAVRRAAPSGVRLVQQDPGQGDVLVLAEVVQVVVGLEVLVARPGERLVEAARGDEQAGPLRRNRPHVG